MKIKNKSKKIIAIIIIVIILTSIILTNVIIKKQNEKIFSKNDDLEFSSLDDPSLQDYLIDTLYSGIDSNFSLDDYIINSISTTYVSKEYIDELTYNSKSNAYFGFDLNELANQFIGKKFVFTVDENNETTVKEFENYNDTYIKVLKNVAIGGGVILACVGVSVLSSGTAVYAIFAVSAKTAATLALSSGATTGVLSSAIEYYKTGNVQKSLDKGLLDASDSFKWGAILGAVTGGASEALKQANEADKIKTLSFHDRGKRAEAKALKKYGGKEQVAFLNGKEVDSTVMNSTRPDILRDYKNTKEAIEVKTYNLDSKFSRDNLIKVLHHQVSSRNENLPKGYKQRIVLDVQGRNYDKKLVKSVVKEIKENLSDVYKNIPVDIMY